MTLCGNILPSSRACRRAPWWPGGRCPQCGFGAETVEDWVRGLAIADNLPAHVSLMASADAIGQDGDRWDPDALEFGDAPLRVVVSVCLWRSRFDMLWAKELSVSDAAVLGDRLESDGIGGAGAPHPLGYFVARLREATAEAMRAVVRLSGGEQAASDAALALRARGVDAFATGDMVVLTSAAATQLMRTLQG